MKKQLSMILVLIFIATLSYGQNKIRITNGEWEPFMSEYMPHYAPYSHIVTEAFKAEGVEVEYGFFPWKRSLALAKTGTKWDASAVWWPTRELGRDFYISQPVGETSYVFFHLKSYKFDWNNIKDLSGKKIGITAGYDYGRGLMNAIKRKRVTVDEVPSDEINFKKLLKGRIDIFPNDPNVGASQIRSNFTPEQAKLFTSHPKGFAENNLSLIISKKSKNGKLFLKKFNSGLKKIKANGKFDQIMADLKNGKYAKQKTKWKQ